MKYVIAFFGFFFLFSCSDMKKGAQLQTISALQARLDAIQSEWNPLELKAIDSLEALSSNTMDSIDLYYQEQEVDKTVAQALDIFKQSNLSLKELQKIHVFLPTLILEKSKALVALKNDVEKGSGRREKYDEFIAFENKEIAMINEQYQNYVQMKAQSMARFESTQQTVNQFLEMLKSDAQ